MKMYIITVKYLNIIEYSVKGETLSRDRLPRKTYIIIHVCAQLRHDKRDYGTRQSTLTFFHKKLIAPADTIHRGAAAF